MVRKRKSREVKYEKVVKSDTDNNVVNVELAVVLLCYFLANSIAIIFTLVLGMDVVLLGALMITFNIIIMWPLADIIFNHFETRKVYYRRIK